MIPFPSRVLIFAAVASALAMVAVARAGEPAIIAKARGFLGTEEVLSNVKSVHYIGTVTTVDPADPKKEMHGTIEIIAQKPDQQRVVAKSEKAIETTALDGYEAWQRTQDPANPQNQRQIVFSPDAVKRLRAQAWENLSFFRGLEHRGGRMEEQGTREIDGMQCQKVAFIYLPSVVFYRYFDTATGRLVQTETEDGGVTREEGQQIVAGVRFPTRMKMTLKSAKGQPQTVTITFDKITVNEPFPPELFRVPSPGS